MTDLPKTVLYPETFRQSNPCNADGVFDWGAFTVLDGKSCFPRDITPMDIDANVEIRWQHLIMESKTEGKQIPSGQMQALQSLVSTRRVTLICIWGKLIPSSWAVETRSELIYPLMLRFGGSVTKDIGSVAKIDHQSVDCEKVFDFLQQWSKIVDGRRR